MEIEIRDAMEFAGYCHLYHQQHIIDQQIDLAEFKNRLGWINYDTNVVTFAEEIAKDEHLNSMVQQVKDILASQ